MFFCFVYQLRSNFPSHDMQTQKQWDLEVELLRSAETGDITRLHELLDCGVDKNAQDKVRCYVFDV